MSSVSKGDAFELLMKHRVELMLQRDELPVIGKYCKVFSKKSYYSKDREADIIVDLSIECTLPGEAKPSMYLMIECKDYKGTIPINDLEEFYAKTQQITGLNVKALFFTTATLQKSALNYAINKGIRTARIHPDGRTEVMSYRKNSVVINKGTADMTRAFLALTSPEESLMNLSFVGLGPGAVYYNLQSLLAHALSSES